MRHRRFAVIAEVQTDEAGVSLGRKVVRGDVAIGTILTEGGDRAVHDARVTRRHGGVADPEAIDHARAERLDEDICRLGEAQQRLTRLGVLEVEAEALLAAVGVAEEHAVTADRGTDMAVRLAFARWLDLDHRGAMVGHHEGGLRPGKEQREVDDAQTCEFHWALFR